MSLDPRTPVVVGVGQVTTPPDASLEPAERPEPLELMVTALRAAAEDCDGVAPGAAAPSGHALLRRADSLRVVFPLGWRSANPALQVAGRLGLRAGRGARAAHALLHRRQQPPGAHARRLPGHLPRRARRRPRDGRRGHVHARAVAPAARRGPARLGRPAGGGDTGAGRLRRRQARRVRPRDAARGAPARARLSAARERLPRRPRLDTGRARGRASARCGPASARSRRATPTHGSGRRGRRRRS